jgi:hypothetical protein
VSGSVYRRTILFDGHAGMLAVYPDSSVGALAVSLMTNAAITGATVDIDGGQQLT